MHFQMYPVTDKKLIYHAFVCVTVV